MASKHHQHVPFQLINRLAGVTRVDRFERLEFPLRVNQKKHFMNHNIKDQVQIGLEELSPQFKNIKRNYLDTSDIPGSQPKKFHVMRSEKHLSLRHKEIKGIQERNHDKGNENRQRSETKLSYFAELPRINPQAEFKHEKVTQKLKTEPTVETHARGKVFERYERKKTNPQGKKRSLLYNPTFISSLFFI